MRAFFAALGLTVVLAACVPEAGPETGVGSTGDCGANGGTMVVGMAGPTCAMPTPDAGKACTKPADCSGVCLGETMTCSALTPMFGCYEVVMEGGQKAMLCVD
jgi:hypothetical protein